MKSAADNNDCFEWIARAVRIDAQSVRTASARHTNGHLSFCAKMTNRKERFCLSGIALLKTELCEIQSKFEISYLKNLKQIRATCKECHVR